MNPSEPSASTAHPNPQQSHGPSEINHQHEYQQAAATATAALSQENSPSSHASPPNGRKRRATGAPGSRGVANLTPEQLAKKRANDREAQRAIRERTRNTIETLERRILELESQQPYQDLQRALQERDRALAECEDLRRRLETVAGIVAGNNQQHPSLNELAALTAQQTPLPPIISSPHPQQPPDHYAPHAPQPHLHPALRSPEGQSEPSHQDPSLNRWSGGAEATSKHAPNETPLERHRSPSAPAQPQPNGDRLGVSFLLDSSQQHTHSAASPPTSSLASPKPQDQPWYARLPRNLPPTCPLDSLLLDFVTSRRKMLQTGASVKEAIGPETPIWDSWLDPDTRPAPGHEVSTFLAEILSTFPDIARLPEKVAVLVVMFHLTRWLICPDQARYENLPPWCRPTPEQLENSHVAWSDHVPWPHMRRQLALRGRDVKFEDFFVPFTTTLALNWALPDDCILLPLPTATGAASVQINPAFEHHLRNLDNWSLGAEFQRSFPELVDASVKIEG